MLTAINTTQCGNHIIQVLSRNIKLVVNTVTIGWRFELREMQTIHCLVLGFTECF